MTNLAKVGKQDIHENLRETIYLEVPMQAYAVRLHADEPNVGLTMCSVWIVDCLDQPSYQGLLKAFAEHARCAIKHAGPDSLYTLLLSMNYEMWREWKPSTRPMSRDATATVDSAKNLSYDIHGLIHIHLLGTAL